MTLSIGALEASRWAGLVFATGPNEGVGVRLAFTDPGGRRRDRDDWYWMVSLVGPHAPDGSYARMEFDLSAEASPESEPRSSTLIVEWSRGSDAVALRATARSPGRLELIGDAPWRWDPRWAEVEEGDSAAMADAADAVPLDGWRAVSGGVEIVTAFAPATRRRMASDATLDVPARPGEVARFLDVAENTTGRLVMVAAWGGAGAAARAARLVERADAWIDAARRQWGRRRPRAADHPDLLKSIADNLMWTVLLQPETARLYAPAGRRWIFPRPGVAAGSAGRQPGASTAPASDDWTVFGWDSFFNALQLAAVSGELAWAALQAGVRSRYPNGCVPNWRSRHGGTPDRSQPPIGSYAALRLQRTHPDPDTLAAVYPDLVAWCQWWVADKDGRPRREGLTPGLLAWGSDTALVPGPGLVPAWEEGADGHQRAAWESGQDDLPLWDEADWDPDRQVFAMSAVDLCSYRALDLECLSRIARILRDDTAADRFATGYLRLVEVMNRVLWCEDAGLYLDELPSGLSARVAASNFLPLIAGVPTRRRARRMVETLCDPARFWGDWVLPTIARDDPAFADQQYWRGSIWPPMNYLILQGLRRYGFDHLAHDLAWKGARMFLADRRRTGMCRENFDSRTGAGCGHRFQSWAPLFALGALEELEDFRPGFWP
ncbi:MAG: trehalase family glycosidase [Gemmatimonadota bacterium]|nr:trehalase family glycosidase [Gemmatimonadota bacterium]